MGEHCDAGKSQRLKALKVVGGGLGLLRLARSRMIWRPGAAGVGEVEWKGDGVTCGRVASCYCILTKASAMVRQEGSSMGCGQKETEVGSNSGLVTPQWNMLIILVYIGIPAGMWG